MSSEKPENGLFQGLEDHYCNETQDEMTSFDDEQIDDHSSDSEIDSSDLEDITEDNENQGALWEFCQHPNAAKKFVKKQLYNGEQAYNMVGHMLGKSDRFVREQVHHWEANQAFLEWESWVQISWMNLMATSNIGKRFWDVFSKNNISQNSMQFWSNSPNFHSILWEWFHFKNL